MSYIRHHQRAYNALRPVQIHRHYTKHAEGSVLIQCGDTHVLCTATVNETVPAFLRGKGTGWITAEYNMLPRATHTRSERESVKGKLSGRTHEIQRLIGRTLRSAVDLSALGERCIVLDCDVLQADGGTRTASITGSYIALHDAISWLTMRNVLEKPVPITPVAAVSVGIYHGIPLLDLDYEEDANCDTDMNIVMNTHGELIEIQGTAEGKPFTRERLNSLLDMAEQGIQQLCQLQQNALHKP